MYLRSKQIIAVSVGQSLSVKISNGNGIRWRWKGPKNWGFETFRVLDVELAFSGYLKNQRKALSSLKFYRMPFPELKSET